MPELILLIGLPATGKSTFYAEKYPKYVHINLDILKTRPKELVALEDAMVAKLNIVVDNTNVTVERRAFYIELAKRANYSVKGYYFSSTAKECLERNNKRKKKVPRIAIYTMAKKLQRPSRAEGFAELFYVKLETTFVIEEWKDE